MQRVLIAAALLAAAFYAYGEFNSPGGFKISSSGKGGVSGFSGARKSAIGGIVGAAKTGN